MNPSGWSAGRGRTFFRSAGVSLAIASACAGCNSDDGAPAGAQTTPPAIDAGPAAEPIADYLIVAADSLAESAGRFKAFRESTGHSVIVGLTTEIVGADKTASPVTKVRDWVKARYEKRDTTRPFFLLLLGDATDDGAINKMVVPAGEFIVPRGDIKVVTDNLYADMDGDDIPDLAVGRIAVTSNSEADVVLEKTKRFESQYELGPWNRRLSLFASTAGFSAQIDAQIESLVFKIVEEIPYDYDINLTYAKQTSPYVFVPERFSDKVYERINEGSLMMAYVGHGFENGFAELDWNSKSFPILDTTQLSKIDVAHKSPLLTLIACLTGRFTAGDSLAETILRSKGGPVGVYASTEISHPYANAVFIRELAQTITRERPATSGEVFVRAKRRSIENADAIRGEIDQGVGTILSADARESLRHSHLYMYTLFGDPAARVAYPREKAEITLGAANAAPGTQLEVSATLGKLGNGSALVTLETRRSDIGGKIAPVPADGDATRDSVITANYTTANDRVVAKQTPSHADGSLQTTLALPADLATGDYYVKVYADDGSGDAIGSTKISVSP
jgi:hypothetical protein